MLIKPELRALLQQTNFTLSNRYKISEGQQKDIANIAAADQTKEQLELFKAIKEHEITTAEIAILLHYSKELKIYIESIAEYLSQLNAGEVLDL